MEMIIKIAWRNLWRHKGKSLIVGTILFIGATIMTVGTGVISGMNLGLQKNIVQGFTGDIVLASQKQENDNVFLDMMAQSIEPLPEYGEVKKMLASSDVVESWMPMGKNTAMVLNEEGGSMDGAFILGVDIAQYNDFFPENLELLQGKTLKPREKGVLLATGTQKIFVTSMGLYFAPESTAIDTTLMPKEAKEMGDELIIKRSMVFMGVSSDNTSTDIRLPIRGLVKYRALNTIFGSYIIMDIESYRQCMGYVTAENSNVEIPESNAALLADDSDDLDDLFGAGGGGLIIDDSEVELSKNISVDLSEGSDKDYDIDAGAYNLVLLKLREGIESEEALKIIQESIDKSDLEVRPIIWHKAIGTIGSLAMLIKASLFVFVMLLFFVAIVIIVNTLSMAALERTSEIGMMRAIGARKGFISNMFFAETTVLAAFFGSLGIGAGWIIVMILRGLHISTTNDMVQLIYGGDTFKPFLTAGDFVLVVLQLILVVLLAVVYPMIVARGITPLDAISRE